MPHQTSSTRNDYERKINYDWPKIVLLNSGVHSSLYPKLHHQIIYSKLYLNYFILHCILIKFGIITGLKLI